jgi:Fe-S cluster biogenesis protein NfuA/nitrite reductase/ring-hydroxylating ferredoxin subunit
VDLGRVEAAIGEVESQPQAMEAVQAIVEMYGEGLARIMERVDSSAFLDDELITHLLIVHDLHPVPLEERVRGALEEVRPYMESHKGGVELVSIEDGVVRLRLQGSCSGCPSSTMTLKLAIEDAIHKAAPDVDEVVADGVVEEAPAPLQIQVVGQGWATVDSLAGTEVRRVEGREVLFTQIGDSSYAYRTRCPACHASLGADSVRGTELTCPGCGAVFDAIRAGRCADKPHLQLEPVPLLEAGGHVKVAVA